MSSKEELYRKVALNLMNKYICEVHTVWLEYGGGDEEDQTELFAHISHYLDLLDAENEKERFKEHIETELGYKEEDWLE